jgi:hypothetical protein
MVYCQSLKLYIQGWHWSAHLNYGTNKANLQHKYYPLSVLCCMLLSMHVPTQWTPDGKASYYIQYKSHYSHVKKKRRLKLPVPGWYRLNHLHYFSLSFNEYTLYSKVFEMNVIYLNKNYILCSVMAQASTQSLAILPSLKQLFDRPHFFLILFCSRYMVAQKSVNWLVKCTLKYVRNIFII